MKKEISNELSAEQLAELEALADKREDEIDIGDAPEVLDWTGARRGLFYESRSNESPTYEYRTDERLVRVDEDVMTWFLAQAHVKSHQTGPKSAQIDTQINDALRQFMHEQMGKAG